MKKQIADYILRVVIFILLSGALHQKISIPLTYGLESCFEFFYEKFPFLESSENAQILFSILAGLFCLFTAWIGVTYVFAKICGLFKKLDGLKKWQALLIIVIIDIALWIIGGILGEHRSINISIRSSVDFIAYTLIPSYLFYLYLNHLTKKHPVPFKKIGYFFSIEFVKDIYNKVKQ